MTHKNKKSNPGFFASKKIIFRLDVSNMSKFIQEVWAYVPSKNIQIIIITQILHIEQFDKIKFLEY